MAVIVIAAYASGRLDAPLSNLGLNTRTCAKNLFGNKMCGDELVQFCRDNYNASANGATCDSVLSDAGIDPNAVAERQRAAERTYDKCVQRAVLDGGDGVDCGRP